MSKSSQAAVLFVCLGNICRSPLAEAALRAEAERLGLDIHVDSAGTSDWHIGKAPDPRACALAARKGFPIDHLQARQLDEADFRRFTHIFALDADNLAGIKERAPDDATAHVGLLMDCVSGREGQGVIDPYYGEEEGFEVTWSDVTAAARAFAGKLAEERV